MGDGDGCIAFVTDIENVADTMNFGKERGFGIWNSKLDAHPPGGQAYLELLKEGIHALAGECGNRNTAGIAAKLAFDDLPFRKAIDLIERNHGLLPIGAELGQRFINGSHLLAVLRMAEIDDMDQEVGLLTSSSVALNDSINMWGSLRMNPTVSVRSILCLFGRVRLRVVGSRVAKRRSTARTSAPVTD